MRSAAPGPIGGRQVDRGAIRGMVLALRPGDGWRRPRCRFPEPFMRSSNLPRAASGAVLVLSFLAASCGGGGGGSAGETSNSFILTDVKYGRLVDDGTGPELISPLTTVTYDPVTGKVLPGSVVGLAPEVDVAMPQTFGIGADYLPRVVPRNGVLQLEFSAPIEASSSSADVLDASGNVLTPGSVQVRLQDGRGIPVTLTQPFPGVIWINPVTPGSIGFPPSPVDFGPSGEPRADATGYLKLRLPRSNGPVLRSTGDSFLGARADHLGDVATPIGINPGNVVLDFIAQNQLIPSNETFNGFLPDTRAPRIVRTYKYEKALSTAGGDSASSSSITDVAATFSSSARKGL